MAQYNYGVSSSSQIIFLLLNLLCLHRKLANCDVGGFFFFFLNATGGVAVLGKVMVNLYYSLADALTGARLARLLLDCYNL